MKTIFRSVFLTLVLSATCYADGFNRVVLYKDSIPGQVSMAGSYGVRYSQFGTGRSYIGSQVAIGRVSFFGYADLEGDTTGQFSGSFSCYVSRSDSIYKAAEQAALNLSIGSFLWVTKKDGSNRCTEVNVSKSSLEMYRLPTE